MCYILYAYSVGASKANFLLKPNVCTKNLSHQWTYPATPKQACLSWQTHLSVHTWRAPWHWEYQSTYQVLAYPSGSLKQNDCKQTWL